MYFQLPVPEAEGVFVERVNRFLGVAEFNGVREYVHIHDPGRLRELLRPGAKIWARRKEGGKTKYYLLAVELEGELVLVDSALHNKIAAWLIDGGVLFPGYRLRSMEPRFGGGRFDLLLESPGGRLALVEIKGVTLEVGGAGLFPDAPTARGARHMAELAEAVERGYEAYVVFLVFRKYAEYFSPHWEMDRKFGEALVNAYRRGVGVIAAKLEAFKWGLKFVKFLPVRLFP